MIEEPPELVAMRLALGQQLAALRESAGIVQQQIGHKTDYSRSSVAHAEAGRQLLTRSFWETADELVGAEGELLAGYERVRRAKEEHEARSREAELAEAYAAAQAHAQALRANAPSPLQNGSGLVVPAGQEVWAGLVAAVGAELAETFAMAGGFRPGSSPSFQLHESLPLPSPDVAVARSQEAWRTVRRYLGRYGVDLAKQAVRLYDPAWQVPHTPTLASPGWVPSRPVPIESVTLEWVPQPPRPVFTGQEAELRPVLPLRAPRHAFPQYTSAIRYLSPPSLFENRPSYRLLDVCWESSGQGTLRFGLATFFDKLDVSEALSHEFAAAMMEGASPGLPQLPFRALLSQPFDLSARIATTSIDTLTIRRNTADGSCTFFLLGRDPAKVVVGGNEYGVIPAGEFQPASISPASTLVDLDLWRNVVREYSEELLGQPEHDGSSGRPLDYECWQFYRAMQCARESGQVRGYVLGVVLHALSLNPSVVTAVVIDDVVFDHLFRDLVVVNAEGRVVTSLDGDQSVYGLPFTEATVQRFLDREPLGGTSAACLALAWRWRGSLIH